MTLRKKTNYPLMIVYLAGVISAPLFSAMLLFKGDRDFLAWLTIALGVFIWVLFFRGLRKQVRQTAEWGRWIPFGALIFTAFFGLLGAYLMLGELGEPPAEYALGIWAGVELLTSLFLLPPKKA